MGRDGLGRPECGSRRSARPASAEALCWGGWVGMLRRHALVSQGGVEMLGVGQQCAHSGVEHITVHSAVNLLGGHELLSLIHI
eukprot:15480480-Alexandrium_andersonii.AAC.1